MTWRHEAGKGATRRDTVGQLVVEAAVRLPVRAVSDSSLLVEGLIATSPLSLDDICDEQAVHDNI